MTLFQEEWKWFINGESCSTLEALMHKATFVAGSCYKQQCVVQQHYTDVLTWPDQSVEVTACSLLMAIVLQRSNEIAVVG